MSEWSPGGNYSCPGTPIQTGRSKSQNTQCTTRNIQAVSEIKKKSLQLHSMEDIPKASHLTTNTVKKLTGNGVSDPRFKRVISSGGQNDACVGTDIKNSRPSLAPRETGSSFSKISTRHVKEFIPNQKNLAKTSEQKLKQPDSIDKHCNEKLTATEDAALDQLIAVDKLSFNHDLVVKSFLKDSLSACTINTRNTSIASEECDELPNELKREPSVTKTKKIENWIQAHTSKIEKKHSLVTVIGQMQGPETLSSTRREIDKRRKLVKELDRYAVCKKITEPDKEETENYNLTNISCLPTAERVLFPDSDGTLSASLPHSKGDKLKKRNSDLPNNENSDVNTDSSMPLSVSRESSSTKNKLRKSQASFECFIKGKVRLFFSGLYSQKMLCVLVLIGGIFCWFAFFSVQTSRMSFDIFTSKKPKPLTWYEKLCHWIWDFFRPSAVGCGDLITTDQRLGVRCDVTEKDDCISKSPDKFELSLSLWLCKRT